MKKSKIESKATLNGGKYSYPLAVGGLVTLGLTKREQFAVTILNGLLPFQTKVERSILVQDAVRYADALLIELEKETDE
jgi:hypothetical protein